MPASRTALDPSRLTVALERLISRMRHFSPPNDISLTAASTLRRLDRDGPHRLTELATAEGVTQPAMTQLVQRLEREALAERAADPTDGRVVLVRVTDAGRALLERRRAQRAEQLATMLAELSTEDEALIGAALPALERLAK